MRSHTENLQKISTHMLIKHKIILTSQKKIEMGKAHASASN
jgi:hypothetical protein